MDAVCSFNENEWKAIFGGDEEESEKEIEGQERITGGRQVDGQATQHTTSQHSTEVALPRSASASSSSEVSPAIAITTRAGTVNVEHSQPQTSLSSFDLMDLCMKRGQELRTKGSVKEADALTAAGFTILDMMAKAVKLLQSNEQLHFGSLMKDAVEALINKGTTNEVYSLVFCTESIQALLKEIKRKMGFTEAEQPKAVEETEGVNKTNTKEYAAMLAKERKKRKMEEAYSRNRLDADEKRRRREVEQVQPRSLHGSPPVGVEHHVETLVRNWNGKLTVTNRLNNRQELHRRLAHRMVGEEIESPPQLSHSDMSNIPVVPTPPDDGEVIGPVSAEVLMEESENDSNISSILPTFPVYPAADHRYTPAVSSSCTQWTPYGSHMPTHSPARNEPPVFRERSHLKQPPPNIPCGTQQVASSQSPSSVNHRKQVSSRSPEQDLRSPSKREAVSKAPSLDNGQKPAPPEQDPRNPAVLSSGAQKYAGVNFANVRKASVSTAGVSLEKSQSNKRKVVFRAESEYSVVEVPEDPNTTREKLAEMCFFKYREKYPLGSACMPEEDERRKQLEKLSLPPREYDFFLGPTTSRPSGSINARTFVESCFFSRGDIRNWLIVGSKFDRLDEQVLDVRKHGCPKTHLTRASYPPVHFRMFCDTLKQFNTTVAGLNIFLAAGEDWVVKQSLSPEEFIAFIRSFAGVLFDLYVRQYETEIGKEMEFVEDSDKVKKGYAYVEMPTILLVTIPEIKDAPVDAKCIQFSEAIKELVRSWDISRESPYYHAPTNQCIEVKLIDWRQMCINEEAISKASMIVILLKHLMEEYGVTMVPANR